VRVLMIIKRCPRPSPFHFSMTDGSGTVTGSDSK
jgi:hypothetical protein